MQNAMDSATNNAYELISTSITEQDKTTELTEIISGAESIN